MWYVTPSLEAAEIKFNYTQGIKPEYLVHKCHLNSCRLCCLVYDQGNSGDSVGVFRSKLCSGNTGPCCLATSWLNGTSSSLPAGPCCPTVHLQIGHSPHGHKTWPIHGVGVMLTRTQLNPWVTEHFTFPACRTDQCSQETANGNDPTYKIYWFVRQ